MDEEMFSDEVLKKKFIGKNFILELDDEIHHIVRADYLTAMLAENKLVLKKVMKWDDPYEAVILRRKIRVGEKIVPISECAKKIYGQCWTSKKTECDGLWRVYSDNRKNDVVRITTTVRLLLRAVLKSCMHNPKSVDFAVDSVKYLPQADIDEKNRVFYGNKNGNARGMGEQFLFFKREEFRYEEEFRLVFVPMLDGINENANGTVSVPLGIPLKELLSRVQFSPWMCCCKKEALKEKLLSLEFPEEKIASSDLYEPPQACARCESASPDVRAYMETPDKESEEEYAKYRKTVGMENESEKSPNGGIALENDEFFTPGTVKKRAIEKLKDFGSREDEIGN